ncbi:MULTISPECIES: type II secretion system major pseudopilin GspG [unclassified Caulobacter]|uniref:type II secretion system major pseudopilin GspG n=1 Tax=unclassified Caulobacter TaxID=2648921 RepID=UPI0006FFCB7D|nr:MULTISPECIES: type II secretion system major pseudopilin GspG [unclassified Caulobacter]KQV58691.1 hypothetical protein ASC62_07915 [Caulobacter sp. Root342]KQV68800.1 hypothetical protein ASC70_08120 [Caulobacter sp. Root343]
MRHADRRRIEDSEEGSEGYTLTEMLVVISIIAVIAAFLTPALFQSLQRTRAKAAKLQLDTVASAVELFRADTGRYPTGEEKLTVLVSSGSLIEGWTGPYLKDAKTLKDPWGRDILYTLNTDGQSFAVSTLGADNKEGGTGVNLDLQAPANTTTTTVSNGS